jgi:hypothetical protein
MGQSGLAGDGGEVVDGFVGAFGVVQVHPFQGGGFDLVQVSPGPSALMSSVLYRPMVALSITRTAGGPASAERPRPRSHSVAGRLALGWL